ncbi:leucine-rich PPR motif-containing protein, mitochondrial isoform X1 [Pundamilia nyererei]|uniref:Leucine-rich PPR motif-containing protein, mitochondrial isoform X1 n=1 Tax=Pundamilia nyererei TaxID=303518 RepID=A0A9Y3QS26_9CICH|nr:PREDICTED: leucine-rich PPR motif-containing protein, mitochondrial isoform X1 [Pundamilia nyererei]
MSQRTFLFTVRLAPLSRGLLASHVVRMFFHAATENMAALLRSSRLLKFSPSRVLQITCTKRNGPTLGRLYSGALCGRRTGVCARQIGPVTENAASRVWSYAAGCVRSFSVATELKDEASIAVRSKQAQQFDWALTRLDSSVRRTGRITKTLLLRIFHDICRAGYPSGNQALLLLRSCGSLLPEVPLEERTELAHRVWEKLKELGEQYDVSHYNALLKVYLQNEFKFSPTDFLAKMEAANIQPNRVTYQRLIAAYCQNGDIEGASTILGFMKNKDLPITEAVFSSLVTGHARAGDIESAKNILSVMHGAGIEPGPDTYVSLLNAYAEKGDLENMKKTLEAAESADCSLMDRDIMQVIFTLAKSKHQQHIPEMVERLRHEKGYVPDAMNMCLSLITQGQEDTAFHILKAFPTLQSDNSSDSANLGNFFLRHCINMDTSLEKIICFCKELQESNMHTSPVSFTLSCALEAKKTGTSLELMKLFKEEKLPVRPHFFWPLLTQPVKDKNIAGVVEVIKGMQDLDVSPDVETLSNYILPVFPGIDAARQALKDAGISVESEGFLCSEMRLVAVTDLAKLYTLLSDPSFPSLDLGVFRSSLILGFKKSADVESMVKITEVLYKDERFSKGNSSPAEATAYFLYNLIDSMSEGQVRAQEDKLRKFFSQLQSTDIMISLNFYRGIRNLLDSCHVPELVKDVMALVGPKEKDSNGPVSATPRAAGIEGKVLGLENKLAELKAENKPLGLVLKQAIQALSAEENLQRALELKQQHEKEMTAGGYAILINLCCRQNNVEEALNLKRELSRKDSSVALDASKYLALVKVLSVNGRIEEAVDILKEMKEKDVPMNGTHITTLFHALNTVAAGGDIPSIRRLQDTVFTLGLVTPTANLCSPVVTAYLVSKDVSGALEAALECQTRYNHLPRIHDIIVALMEKGETELLQKAMDFVSQERGEMAMLYDLFFAFLQTGRYREARKIIETPGLRAKPGRVQWYAEKCILSNQLEALEQMVDMTAKLFECDRDEMYNYLLRLCKETNNWQKAEAMWTKMQEENVIPRERTLRLLADILKSNGQEVPFEVPETWYQQAATTPTATESVSDYQVRLLALCKKGKAKEVFGMLKEADKKGVALDPSPYDHLIRALLAEGSMDEAMAVKDIAETRVPGFKLTDIANSLLIITQSKKGQVKEALERLMSMLQLGHVPSHLAITRLVQALGSHGNVEGIQDVESLIKSLGTSHNLSSMVFVNNTALAHIKNDDVSSAVELLEGIYTSPDSTNPSMSFVFRKVLEAGNDHAMDKLSAMAERLANHFACYRPASDLFIQLLDMDKVEDAKFMLARCNALAEQKEVLLSFVSRKAQTPGQVGKIKNLLSLIPDFAEKELLYPYLMKCHALDKDLPAAEALHEQMQKEGIVVDELSLKRLAVLYRKAGETVPFPEPPESFKFYADKLRAAKAQATAEE